jgi:hypothetical protein
MEQKDSLAERKRAITELLSSLPRKILGLHGRDNVVEFVLHELSRQECFDLEKAAYVIDNPDFDCLKGVAGFQRPEAYNFTSDIWTDPDSFSEHMKKSKYNNDVRCYHRNSGVKNGEKDEEIVKEIAHDLGFDKPFYYSWDMKHDNHGILLYEKRDSDNCDCDYLLEGLCLIGFCPVF